MVRYFILLENLLDTILFILSRQLFFISSANFGKFYLSAVVCQIFCFSGVSADPTAPFGIAFETVLGKLRTPYCARKTNYYCMSYMNFYDNDNDCNQ